MNYWLLGEKIKLSYMYIDLNVNSDYVADSLFNKHGIDVQFGREMKREGDRYRAIFCKIKRKDKEAFEYAMKELVDKMFLLGYKDYVDYCVGLREELAALGDE